MKFKIICFSLLLLLFACSKKIETSNNDENFFKKSIETRKPGRPFFEFDKVEHYFMDISKDDANDLFRKEKTSKHDSILSHLLIQNDMKYTDELENYNFKKNIINESKLDSIKSIFSENNCETSFAAACIPIYRDIFIFKNKDKVVGKAKVCFDCQLDYIVGSRANTDNFGQCGDFEKLERVIRNN